MQEQELKEDDTVYMHATVRQCGIMYDFFSTTKLLQGEIIEMWTLVDVEDATTCLHHCSYKKPVLYYHVYRDLNSQASLCSNRTLVCI